MNEGISYRARITWMVPGDDRLHFKNVNSVDPQPIMDTISAISDIDGAYDLIARVWKTTVEEIPFYV